MKKILYIFGSLVLVVMLSVPNIFGCSIHIPPLRKQFRTANSVFAGRVVKIIDTYTPTEQEKKSIPDYWTEGYWKDKAVFSRVTFEITRKWKGELSGQRDFVAMAYFVCGCSQQFDSFKVGKEYLVYAEGKNFASICESKDANYEQVRAEMKRLDQFWFRAWARIYPF